MTGSHTKGRRSVPSNSGTVPPEHSLDSYLGKRRTCTGGERGSILEEWNSVSGSEELGSVFRCWLS